MHFKAGASSTASMILAVPLLGTEIMRGRTGLRMFLVVNARRTTAKHVPLYLYLKDVVYQVDISFSGNELMLWCGCDQS